MSYMQPWMAKELAEHELEEIAIEAFAVTNRVRVFWMRKPGTGIYSVLLAFLPTGIALSGDLRIGSHRGGAHAPGYGLDWFASELNEDYLCSKFLDETWQHEAAVENIRARIESAAEDGETETASRWNDVLAALASHDETTSEMLADMIYEAGLDFEYLPGYDYPRAHAGWLIAVQQRFRELYWAKYGDAVTTSATKLPTPEAKA